MTSVNPPHGCSTLNAVPMSGSQIDIWSQQKGGAASACVVVEIFISLSHSRGRINHMLVVEWNWKRQHHVPNDDALQRNTNGTTRSVRFEIMIIIVVRSFYFINWNSSRVHVPIVICKERMSAERTAMSLPVFGSQASNNSRIITSWPGKERGSVCWKYLTLFFVVFKSETFLYSPPTYMLLLDYDMLVYVDWRHIPSKPTVILSERVLTGPLACVVDLWPGEPAEKKSDRLNSLVWWFSGCNRLNQSHWNMTWDTFYGQLVAWLVNDLSVFVQRVRHLQL